jgi:glycosyltransferase involved in cell wall biosynthesis
VGPIHFDNRWNGPHGIGRFSAELEARLPGVRPLRIPTAKLSPLDPLATTWAACRLRDGIYFSPGFNAPLRSRVPLVFTIHDLTHLYVPGESTAVRRAYYRLVVRPAALRAHRILTGSEFSRCELLEWTGLPPQRVVVVGHGVSAAFHPGDAGARDYFLHVGRRGANKNIGRLVAAYAASKARSGLRLVFTGQADTQTTALAELHGVRDRVSFAGNVSDEELAGLYRGARALVFPSVREGFGLPIIEAMACGTPVITADATSTGEAAGPGNALLVDPLEVDAIAAAMDRIAEDEALARELAMRGRARAAEFTWDAVAGRTRGALDA